MPELEAKGLKFVGRDTTGERMEVIELDDHPFYVGTPHRLFFLISREKSNTVEKVLTVRCVGQAASTTR